MRGPVKMTLKRGGKSVALRMRRAEHYLKSARVAVNFATTTQEEKMKIPAASFEDIRAEIDTMNTLLTINHQIAKALEEIIKIKKEVKG